ncbi:uncharacterized protein BHQ10_008302 [Talaromyces amestolkiae]|uniref:AB hydrolase-1 domain-containing protein n=1 Tax=Talaromyces amestolkiae TaxID=1196081 RepID=A0A364L8Z8_TALAM|nr:uncharacterized protein BHQ10_008302 [Talaromyces amestolkiae]RAO72290.1 hypothetical protein BHQ10_008302 [Talaromyces amestolkiae]
MGYKRVLWIASLLVGAVTAQTAQTATVTNPGDVAYHRTYMYVGGGYVVNSAGQHVFSNQMYVERLTPTRGASKTNPIVFVHGQAQTGTNWLNKPDGKAGWASYFLSQGYECYLIDQTFRGRSPWLPNNGTLSTYSAELLQQRFTAPQNYNLWPQASLHTQWPGTGVMGDIIFDTYYSSTVEFLSSATYQQSTVQAAGAALLDLIGKPAIVLAHSQGGLMPWLLADARPNLVHSIVAIEPTGPPFQEAVFSNTSARAYGLTDIPITYSPAVINPATDLVTQTIVSQTANVSNCVIQADSPAPRQLTNIAQVPVLVVTSESSYHAPYDWCTVEFLQQAGVHTDHYQLGLMGIHGNGHMMFMEKNSDSVARVIQGWIEQH